MIPLRRPKFDMVLGERRDRMDLGLIELVRQLKYEIGQLQYTDVPMFAIEEVELELKFLVEKTVDATGKAHWVLFAAEAKGEYKDQQVNTIKLKLKPALGLGQIVAQEMIEVWPPSEITG